ncbi:MAG: phospholipase D-like domain-containing protein [Methylocella sp.]
MIPDKSNNRSGNESRYSGATFVARAGIPVSIDYRPAIAPDRIIIIDRHRQISGPYNFTFSAERRNVENVTFIESAEIASRFLSNWSARRRGSIPITGNDYHRCRNQKREIRGSFICLPMRRIATPMS